MDFFFPSFSLISPCSLRFLLLTCLHCLCSTLSSCLGSPELCTSQELYCQSQNCEFPESFAGTVDVKYLLLKGSDGPMHYYHSPGSMLFFLLSRSILGIEVVLKAGMPWRIMWKITP